MLNTNADDWSKIVWGYQLHKYISIYSLPDESEYGLDVSNLLHELNERASQNPHMIPLLLSMIHENDDSLMST